MLTSLTSLLLLGALATAAPAAPLAASASGPLKTYETSVTLNGQKFINKGLVAFGAISGDARDSKGDTIGGIGSAIAVKSLKKVGDNTYSGRITVQPDRGWNRVSTVDYEARQHAIDFTLTPYYDSKKLQYDAAKSTFGLTYKSSVFYHEANGVATTGLDANAYRSGAVPFPIPAAGNSHISTDAEGLVVNKDGSFWVSEEYGPFIYKYSKEGKLLTVIEPPAAFLPRRGGDYFFTTQGSEGPSEGRGVNQGFEGLTSNADGTRLYALLQSGLVQDQADGDDARYTRFLEYDVSGTPKLLHAYVVELPVTNGKSKTLGTSEVHYLSDDTFVLLARDSKGNGGDDPQAKNKRFYLFSTSKATDIANTPFSQGYTPVAPDGELDSSVTAAAVTPWVDFLDDTQLARFGLYNGDTSSKLSVSLLNAKWESIAFASVQDPKYPNDYFLFSFSDNDFISKKGSMVGKAYSDDYGFSLDNQALVWRVTLPFKLHDA